MQKWLSKSLILFALLAAVGCERDLEMDLPAGAPRLVVNALICEDSLIRIEVSLSASPGNGALIKSLKDAKVMLYEDNLVVKDFVVDSLLATPLNLGGNPLASSAPTKLYYHVTTSTKSQSGRPYDLEVTYPKMQPVRAKASVPRPVRARFVPEQLNESILVEGRPLDRVQFQIDDNGNKENYYGVEILASKPGSGEPAQKIEFFSGEKAFSENLVVNTGQHDQGVYYRPENGVYFSNGKFKGRRELFEIYVDPDYLTSQYQLHLRVLNLSQEYFLFATSYQKQKQNANNPFAEPTQVYSNIQDGLGIFAGYAVTEVLY